MDQVCFVFGRRGESDFPEQEVGLMANAESCPCPCGCRNELFIYICFERVGKKGGRRREPKKRDNIEVMGGRDTVLIHIHPRHVREPAMRLAIMWTAVTGLRTTPISRGVHTCFSTYFSAGDGALGVIHWAMSLLGGLDTCGGAKRG